MLFPSSPCRFCSTFPSSAVIRSASEIWFLSICLYIRPRKSKMKGNERWKERKDRSINQSELVSNSIVSWASNTSQTSRQDSRLLRELPLLVSARFIVFFLSPRYFFGVKLFLSLFLPAFKRSMIVSPRFMICQLSSSRLETSQLMSRRFQNFRYFFYIRDFLCLFSASLGIIYSVVADSTDIRYLVSAVIPKQEHPIRNDQLMSFRNFQYFFASVERF